MQVTARLDYGLRAVIEIALHPGETMSHGAIAEAQQIPPKYLEAILSSLRAGGILTARRGAAGGYSLAREPRAITVAAIARTLGALPTVRSASPVDGTASSRAIAELRRMLWSVDASTEQLLDATTIADLLAEPATPPSSR